MKAKYRFIGEHAEVLDSGMPIAPGEFYEIDSEALGDHGKSLMDEGLFVEVPAKAKEKGGS